MARHFLSLGGASTLPFQSAVHLPTAFLSICAVISAYTISRRLKKKPNTGAREPISREMRLCKSHIIRGLPCLFIYTHSRPYSRLPRCGYCHCSPSKSQTNWVLEVLGPSEGNGIWWLPLKVNLWSTFDT